MDFKDAMKKRHVVRRYRDEELDLETVSALKKRVEEDNEKYQVHVKLETEDSSVLNLMGKLASKNAVNYFIMSGKESADPPGVESKRLGIKHQVCSDISQALVQISAFFS